MSSEDSTVINYCLNPDQMGCGAVDRIEMRLRFGKNKLKYLFILLTRCNGGIAKLKPKTNQPESSAALNSIRSYGLQTKSLYIQF